MSGHYIIGAKFTNDLVRLVLRMIQLSEGDNSVVATASVVAITCLSTFFQNFVPGIFRIVRFLDKMIIIIIT